MGSLAYCVNAASATARGPRASQKVLTLQYAMPRDGDFKQTLCAESNGFSLHAAARCGANDRQVLEQLCRYITLGGLNRSSRLAMLVAQQSTKPLATLHVNCHARPDHSAPHLLSKVDPRG